VNATAVGKKLEPRAIKYLKKGEAEISVSLHLQEKRRVRYSHYSKEIL